MTAPRSSRSPCLKTSFRHQSSGSHFRFLRVGLVPLSDAHDTIFHPPDAFFHWDSTSTQSWEEDDFVVATPSRAFQLVFHAASGASSPGEDDYAAVQFLAVRPVQCPKKNEAPKEAPKPLSPMDCPPEVRKEKDCRNGSRCFQIRRRDGASLCEECAVSEPFCVCPEGWTGNQCEENWPPLEPEAIVGLRPSKTHERMSTQNSSGQNEVNIAKLTPLKTIARTSTQNSSGQNEMNVAEFTPLKTLTRTSTQNSSGQNEVNFTELTPLKTIARTSIQKATIRNETKKKEKKAPDLLEQQGNQEERVDGMHVICEWNRMTVTVAAKKLLSSGIWKGEDPCLTDPTCCLKRLPVERSKDLVYQLSFSFTECGTTVSDVSRNRVTLKNSIVISNLQSDPSEVRIPDLGFVRIRRRLRRFVLDITCQLQLADQVAASYQAQDELRHNLVGRSSIPIQLNMSVDSQHLGDDLPYQVFLGDKLTFQAFVKGSQSSTLVANHSRIFLEDCYAAKLAEYWHPMSVGEYLPNEVLNKAHLLLADGCPVDPSVSVEPDNSSFTVEAFDFVFDEDAAPSPMLVQCRVALCPVDGASSCLRRCRLESDARPRRHARTHQRLHASDAPPAAHSLYAISRPFVVLPRKSRPSTFARTNLTNVSPETAGEAEDRLEELVYFASLGVLCAIIVALLVSVVTLLVQNRDLRRRLRNHADQILAVRDQAALDGSTYKSIDQVDYWSNFRRILLGGRHTGSNCSEGGEFDVAFDVVGEAEEKRTDDVSHLARPYTPFSYGLDNSAFDRRRTEGDSCDAASIEADASLGLGTTPSGSNGKEDRYRFPGSEMTRELYERRGADLNNN